MSEAVLPVQYWRPSAALSPFVTGYHLYHAALPPGLTLQDVFLPGVASIQVTLHETPAWSLRMGARTFDPMPGAAFVGPTSCAGHLSAQGGTMVGVGLKPLGWAQLFGGNVSRYSNRVAALSQLDSGAAQLHDALEHSDRPDVVFERWLEARLHRRPPVDPRIGKLFAILEEGRETRIDVIADMLDTSPRSLATMTRQSFGFTPKLMLRRTRFVRALTAMLIDPDRGPAALKASGYYDRSHFLRDSHLFLGCSVRDFARRRGPLNQIALRVRQKVLGPLV
ncbi:AraC family transcriptional regulator [Sphingomonas sp. Mn802worker]|uniref:AraC family transcriptional regulator n=1 Tax=Sphingomonas sp. Mn802worker TaxID=629773 RepID=UPI0003A6407E|nr:helix-turn-helix domain-containing protein [Sphingomonas sp. Mn802worker]